MLTIILKNYQKCPTVPLIIYFGWISSLQQPILFSYFTFEKMRIQGGKQFKESKKGRNDDD